jgi:tetratricopeptide (TPR) repeat protein
MPVTPAVRRPAFLTFLAAMSNFAGVITTAAAIAWALWENEAELTAGEARLAGLIAACGLTAIVASHGLLRLRSDARSLQLIYSSVWLVGWAVAGLQSATPRLVAAMTPGAILAAASVVYLSREPIGRFFATAPLESKPRRGLLIGDAIAILFLLLFIFPNLRGFRKESTPQPATTPEAVFDVATELYRADRFAEAVPLFQQFLRVRKDHGLAHSRLGLSLARLERYDEAVTILKRAGELDPADYQSRNNLALTYGRMGKPELGIEPAREAARLKGDDPIVQNTLGYVLLESGRARDAIAPLEMVVRTQPQSVEGRWNLARAYQQTGQRRRARAEVAALRAFDAKSADELDAELRKTP